MKSYKKCSCGTVFSKKEWEKLQYVGSQESEEDGKVFHLELRNCHKCHSTIGVETSLQSKAAE